MTVDGIFEITVDDVLLHEWHPSARWVITWKNSGMRGVSKRNMQRNYDFEYVLDKVEQTFPQRKFFMNRQYNYVAFEHHEDAVLVMLAL